MKLNITVALLVALLSGDVAVAAKTKSKTSRRAEANGKKVEPKFATEKVERKLQELFEETYVTVIGSEAVRFVPGFGSNGPERLLGSVLYTAGGVYKEEDVNIRARTAPGGKKFAGGKQPIKFPARRTNFFITGECTTTAASSTTQITGHTCFYTLCLGGGGGNCVNLYAGGPFEFSPGLIVETGEEPLLPPKFAGIVIGGVGAFAGIGGTFTIETLAGRTTANVVPQFGLIAQKFDLSTTIKLPQAPGPQLAISNVAGEVLN
jgi:hypothetical protein